MITVFSGGTGTPKLIRGLRQILRDNELTIVVNTAEDLHMSGHYVSPDVDTVTYLFAGILNTDTWWGIKGPGSPLPLVHLITLNKSLTFSRLHFAKP